MRDGGRIGRRTVIIPGQKTLGLYTSSLHLYMCTGSPI